MDTQQKLEYLADASRYDLACACGTDRKDTHRVRGKDGAWLYPMSTPRGGRDIIFKTLLSNVCVNECRYCPFREGRDVPRYSLTAEEVATALMSYVRRGLVFGLFLSSGVIRDADHTMGRLVEVADVLRRRHQFHGFIHLKIIPGSSDAAIEEALRVSSQVSLNVEAPHQAAFKQLSPTKDFERDIVGGIRRISQLTAPGAKYSRVQPFTQFVVGAADETDTHLVKATFGLYRRMGMNRVYYSAYQRGLGDERLPGERRHLANPDDVLTREHRLYQAEWLMRKYGFTDEEIPFETDGNLSLTADPKMIWATRNPAYFPVDVNRATKWELLRVPGLGPTTAQRILEMRRAGTRIANLRDWSLLFPRIKVANTFVKFGHQPTRRNTG